VLFRSEWLAPLIPIGFFATIIGGITFTVTRCESCYEPCDRVEIPPKLDVFRLGSVTMPDGEVCHVEEVDRVWYVHTIGVGSVDRERRCVGPVEDKKPLVRRVVCPSGRNGQSSVGNDGSKFHNETLE